MYIFLRVTILRGFNFYSTDVETSCINNFPFLRQTTEYQQWISGENIETNHYKCKGNNSKKKRVKDN